VLLLRDLILIRVTVIASRFAAFFAKRNNRMAFWTMCWDVDEAKELWRLSEKDEGAFDNAFFNIGGVPRHLLNESSDRFLHVCGQRMDTDLTYEQLHKDVNSNVSHCIAMAVPASNRSYAALHTFISKGVENVWRSKRKNVSVAEMRNAYKKCVTENLPKGTCGDFFERLVLTMLLQNASVPLELHDVIPDGAKAAKPRKSTESIAVQSIAAAGIAFDGADAKAVFKPMDAPTVFIPTNQQFPFVDFLIVYPSGDVTGIQCTVSQRHHRPTPSTVARVLGPLKQNGLRMTKIVRAVPVGGGISKRQTRCEKDTKASITLRNEFNAIRQYLLLVS
jgi:hypothetical protein